MTDKVEAEPPLLTLTELINNATRHQHTTLNRLISARLPLALPPHTITPHNYTLGLSQIAQLFFAFESLWDEVTSPPNSQISSLDNSAYGDVGAYPHPHEDAFTAGLRGLRPMGLPRSERLKNDLAGLRQFCNIDEESVGTSQVVKGVVARMEDEIREKPYLLVAYAFTLYLAVLSGGRHIRSELCKAGEDFWIGNDTSKADAAPEKKSAWNWISPIPSLGRLNPYVKKPAAEALSLDEAPRSRKPLAVSEVAQFENLGLSFWLFPGSADGEDLRVKFKANLEELSHYISPSQEDEIVAEAQAIFSRIEALVGELDVAVATGAALGEPVRAEVVRKENAMPDEPLIELKEEASQPLATTIDLPVSHSLAPLPWWAGSAMVVCGVSYAAVVYSNTWP